MNQKDAEFIKKFMALLRPFDPAKDKPKDVGFGGPSTEYLATAKSPDGGAWNYPQIWWTPDGKPIVLEGDAAWNEAQRYEGKTGERFPRYDNILAAIEAAMHRSAMGGAGKKKLAK